MSFTIDPGDLWPPLVMTVTDDEELPVINGVRLVFTDESGAVLFTDETPAVQLVDPMTARITHTWRAGETANPGTYGVAAVIGGDEGESYPASGPLPWSVGGGVQALYCSLTQARNAGASGTDEQVRAAIRAAMRRIDSFTGDVFTPAQMSVAAEVGSDGTALLRRRVRSVSSVVMVGTGVKVPAGAYRVLSSALPGQVDAVVLGVGGADALIVGAEPWSGGWRNLLGGSLGTGQVRVSGSFGWDEPPYEVVAAAATLAGRLGVSGVTDPNDPRGVSPDTDDEGNVVRVTAPTTAEASGLIGGRTTGVRSVDELLAPLMRSRVRIG